MCASLHSNQIHNQPAIPSNKYFFFVYQHSEWRRYPSQRLHSSQRAQSQSEIHDQPGPHPVYLLSNSRGRHVHEARSGAWAWVRGTWRRAEYACRLSGQGQYDQGQLNVLNSVIVEQG